MYSPVLSFREITIRLCKIKFLNHYLCGHFLDLSLCYAARNILLRTGNRSLLILQECQIWGFDFHSNVHLALAHQLQTDVWCSALSQKQPTHHCGLRAQFISCRRINTSCVQWVVSVPQTWSQSQKPSHWSICQIMFDNVEVRKAFILIPIRYSAKVRNKIKNERADGALFLMLIPIPQSLTVIHALVHLHLECNYIQIKITVHKFIPYSPFSPRRVTSSHTGGSYKSASASSPLCQVSFHPVVILQRLGVLSVWDCQTSQYSCNYEAIYLEQFLTCIF